MTSRRFEGKRILITSAGREPGRSLALALAEEGAWLVLQDYSPVNLDALCAQIINERGIARDEVVDITRKIPAQSLVERMCAEWGGIDALIHCAVVSPVASLAQLDEWDWHRVLDMNLSAAFFLAQSMVTKMRRQGGGVCINICAVLPPSAQALFNRVAEASRWALMGLTRAMAAEFEKDNLRVFGITLVPTEEEEVFLVQGELERFKPHPHLPSSGDFSLSHAILDLCLSAAEVPNGGIWMVHQPARF